MGVQAKSSPDERTWLVFELTYQGGKAAFSGELEKHLKDLFGVTSKQVFIPYVTCTCDGRKTLLNVMEGYCFVEYLLEAQDYLRGIRNSPFIKSILHSQNEYHYSLHTISEAHVQDLREKLNTMAVSTLAIGDRVKISQGTYEGIEGEILGITEDSACVFIRMRSLEAIRVIPKSALMPLEEDSDE